MKDWFFHQNYEINVSQIGMKRLRQVLLYTFYTSQPGLGRVCKREACVSWTEVKAGI
jgi:hypothetical protein